MQGFYKAALLALVVVVSQAEAQIYKCVNSEGRTAYQDRPCPEGDDSDELNANVSSMSSSAIRSAAQAAEMAELQKRQQRRLQQLQNQSQYGSSSSTSSYQERLDERNARVSARASGLLPSGSTVRDAERMYGRPDKRERYTYKGSNCERLFWYDRDGHISGYATACDGVVDYYSEN